MYHKLIGLLAVGLFERLMTFDGSRPKQLRHLPTVRLIAAAANATYMPSRHHVTWPGWICIASSPWHVIALSATWRPECCAVRRISSFMPLLLFLSSWRLKGSFRPSNATYATNTADATTKTQGYKKPSCR